MFGHLGINSEDILAHLPEELPVLPLRNTVAFPFSVLPILVGTPQSLRLAEDALAGNRLVLLVSTRDPEIENPTPDDVYTIGSVAIIQRAAPGQNGGLQR